MEKGRLQAIRIDDLLGSGHDARGDAPMAAARQREPGPEPLLTLHDVAEYLQVSEKTVRRLVSRRALPCVRFGGVLRFQQADLFRFVAARKG